ncbi:hypothetical protein [Azospirillum canadense]|uniref:hypothetical protein n=1 Tax=Azospirillum canadense TaxID=403962 RepID=UPI002227C864|nr:hypothetical protein [Azospirillum canadense]MCW2240885.1 cellobiose-specific phosphotransferase system component IIA [Azospirillum canadense]
MAINFATETLKAIISKGVVSTASDVTTSDSAVAKFKAQDTQTLTQTTDGQDTHTQATGTQGTDTQSTQQGGGTDGPHTASDATSGSTAAPAFPSLPNGTLSDSALIELKAAYSEVKTALSDAGTDLTTHGTGAGQGGSPLVKALTEATGENAGTVREVLQQVHAVLRQEHTAQSGDQAGDQANGTGSFWHDRLAQQDHTATDTTAATKTTAGTGTGTGTTTQTAAGTDMKESAGSATDTTSTGANTDTAKDDAAKGNATKGADAGHNLADGHLWHDRLVQQDSGTPTPTHGMPGNGTAATSDGTTAEWHHFAAQSGHQDGADQGATAPTLTTELTSAVDHFMQALEDLHVGQTQGHATDQAAHMTAA